MTSNLQAERYRVVILGGGIHGVGILHDLSSRGWHDVLLLEKTRIGYGTSSRSTKLIHGGLRYLEHIRDFPLVAEGLKERQLLMQLAPDLVKPIPLVFPVLKKGGKPRFMIKAGLALYDFLAGSRKVGKHKSVEASNIDAMAPGLDKNLFQHYYLFYDGQTDDLGLVNRVAQSAVNLGGKIYEEAKATRIIPDNNGYRIIVNRGGEEVQISARYVVNAMGPWAHEILNASGIEPQFEGINNKGSHIVIKDMGLKSGVFLQSPEDERIFFVLPWQGSTLIGTTETPFSSSPENLMTEKEDVQYLIDHYNRFFNPKITVKDITAKFSGLRWLAKDKSAGLSDTSRSYQVSEHKNAGGVIYTIYGGKLTAYRSLSETIGDLILKDFGEDQPSKTDDPSKWEKSGFYCTPPSINIRFQGM